MTRVLVTICPDARECGGCHGEGWKDDHDSARGGEPWCNIFNKPLAYGVDVNGNDPGCEHETQRLPECLAAQAAADAAWSAAAPNEEAGT